MTSTDDAQKKRGSRTRKAPAPERARANGRASAPGGEPAGGAAGAPSKDGDGREPAVKLTGKQALALWELILEGDGKTRKGRRVKLEPSDLKKLAGARLIAVQPGPRKQSPSWGSKIYLTDEAWEWANRQGLRAALSLTKAAAPLLQKLLGRVHDYLEARDLPLDHFLRPRRAEPEEAAPPQAEPRPDVAARTPMMAPPETASRTDSTTSLEQRIRGAYLRVTGGAMNEFVRLALVRAELTGERTEAVDDELRAMEQRGVAILYPFDDPRRIRPEDDAAALRVGGDRRDLLSMKW